MQPESLRACLVDAHVHLYGLFEAADIVESALANFERLAGGLGLPPTTPGVLMLTQTSGERTPNEVLADLPGAWQHSVVDELGCLRICHSGRPDLYMVPGWQVVTREGLEVLALATAHSPPADRATAETLRAVQAAGGLGVLPWGIGKWTGSRASEIRRLIADPELADIFFGDISGRLNLLPRPPLLAMAEAAGHKVLAGSDPLPLAGETQKIGRLGFGASFDPGRPAASLKDWLVEAPRTPSTAGQTEALLRFLKLQLAIQIKKRLS